MFQNCQQTSVVDRGARSGGSFLGARGTTEPGAARGKRASGLSWGRAGIVPLFRNPRFKDTSQFFELDRLTDKIAHSMLQAKLARPFNRLSRHGDDGNSLVGTRQ